MKYKLRLTENNGIIFIEFFGSSGYGLGWIYHSSFTHTNSPRLIEEDGFWYGNSSIQEYPWVDYYKHREEYIAEAKKLLIKHML